jgi:hypothetical protein
VATSADLGPENDRWNYMPEKRAAMKKWNAFVQAMLNKKRPNAAKGKGLPVIHSAAEEAAQLS